MAIKKQNRENTLWFWFSSAHIRVYKSIVFSSFFHALALSLTRTRIYRTRRSKSLYDSKSTGTVHSSLAATEIIYFYNLNL